MWGNDRLVVSAAQAEALDERAVALDVGVLQVVQQATTLSDEQQQSAAAVVVVLVLLQVTGQVRDAAGQQVLNTLRPLGALVVAEVTRRVKVNLQASEADILDGIAWSIVGAGKGQRLPG